MNGREAMQWRRLRVLGFIVAPILLLLACQTVDLMFTAADVPYPTAISAGAGEPATPRSASQNTRRPTAAETAVPAPTAIIPTDEPPPSPTDIPPPPPDPIERPPTQILAPTEIPTEAGPTPSPAPTRCPQQYCAVYQGCQPDAGNTVIEGIVYNNGVPENGVIVRVSVAQGAYPLVDDFVSGNDPINPGAPDEKNPGRYFLQVLAGAPREGSWWVFVVDQRNGTKQLSEGQLVQTQADPYTPTSCQHAFVDFVR
jgi:hypothetical protein